MRRRLRALWWRIWGTPRLVRVHSAGSGPSWEGILVSYGRYEVYLEHSRLLESEERSHDLEGVTRIRHDHYLFIQEL